MFADDTVEGYKGEEVSATLHEKDQRCWWLLLTQHC